MRKDFERMTTVGINAIRTYHVPPDDLFRLADEIGLAVFVDIPWSKHLCFLESQRQARDARRRIHDAAERGCRHSCVLAYSIGNEIPPNVVRWYGPKRIQRFLIELRDVAKQADADGLVTYANYPSTEYLDLSFLDFATFNVYLHENETFRRYLFRLQNLVGDKPLLLGELGMDTLRHGELAQAEFLAGHVKEALLLGLAGVFVFSWTDEWYTGGHSIQDWAFGITHADRFPKASCHALREVFDSSLAALSPTPPRVSVVVCSYNGASTLTQCLQSLLALDYPNYEVIVVNDGSTDDTRKILARFPQVRTIHQSNQGLSAARNVGLQAAHGEIVAYTDSDCYADADWLTHLVFQLQHTEAAAVGGPNLTPEDGWLAACVAAAPGQPTHVLENDQVAEHIPGCNMTFRREALLAINGFDPQYRKAGDDVDVCWRLEQAGFWITFAPGAFVWHHRRQNPSAYLRQQAGYGEAEAMLHFKHPEKFNGRGDGKWRGVLYGASLQGLRLGEPIIYRGIFGTGLFQCIYQRGPAHWAMLPSTLEWHLLMVLLCLAGLFWWPGWLAGGVMLGLSMLVAALQGAQAVLPSKHDGFIARLLVSALCYIQPLVRSWRRYRTRLFSYYRPETAPIPLDRHGPRVRWHGARVLGYWSEQGHERTQLLEGFIATLSQRQWGLKIDSGWSRWDVEIQRHPWTVIQVCTAQEDHGNRKHLLRVRYRMRTTRLARSVVTLGLTATAALAALAGFRWSGAGVLLLTTITFATWWRGAELASQTVQTFDSVAREMGLVRCRPAREESEKGSEQKTFPLVMEGQGAQG
jgi:GT2 family glycosyltransferase